MHMYPWQIAPPSIKQRCLEYCYTKLGTSNGRSIYIYRVMHIYIWQIAPLQSSIDALNTATPNLAHLMVDLSISLSLSLSLSLYIYIYRTMHLYIWQIDPPLQSSIDALHTTTANLALLMADLYVMYIIEQCTYTYGRLTPSN